MGTLFLRMFTFTSIFFIIRIGDEMKKLLDNKVVQIGIVSLFVIAACILFTFILINVKEILGFIGSIIKIMMPLIYGLVLAYIMHPIVNLFDKKIFKKIEK